MIVSRSESHGSDENSSTRHYSETIELIHNIVTVYGPQRGEDGEVILPPGEHHFPFNFLLPELPSSFEVRMKPLIKRR